MGGTLTPPASLGAPQALSFFTCSILVSPLNNPMGWVPISYRKKQVSEILSHLSKVTPPVKWRSQDLNSGLLDSKAHDPDLNCPVQLMRRSQWPHVALEHLKCG